MFQFFVCDVHFNSARSVRRYFIWVVYECNATDSYRLARKCIKLEKEVSNNYNIVIPSRNIVEFTKRVVKTFLNY